MDKVQAGLSFIPDGDSCLVFDASTGNHSMTQYSSIVYLASTTLILLICLITNIVMPSTSAMVYATLSTVVDMYLLAISVSATVQVSHGRDSHAKNLSLIYVLLSLFWLIYLAFSIEKLKVCRYTRPQLTMTSSCWPIIKLVYTTLPLVEKSDTSDFAKNHLQTVLKLLYSEQQQYGMMNERVESKLELALIMKQNTQGLVKSEKNSISYKDLCYDAIAEILGSLTKKFPREMYIRLLYAYVLAGRLQFRWRAVFQLEKILDSDCSITIKIAAVRFRSFIEHEVRENEIYSSQNLGVDAMKILKQQQNFEELKNKLKRGCELNRMFWEELQEKRPSANKLQDLGFEIASSNDSVNSMFKGSSKGEDSQGLRVLEIFGEYLRLVSNEIEESKRILTKVSNIRMSLSVGYHFTSDHNLSNMENLHPCIIVASGDAMSMGSVLQANNESLSLLELSRNELIGEKIDVFLPKVYADHHDYWMRRYFTTNDEKALNIARKVFAKNRRGFLVPVKLLIKIIPDLSCGIKVVGVFTELRIKKTDCTFLIRESTGELLGITKECYDLFGMHPMICYGSPQSSSVCNILQLFTDIENISHLTMEYQKTHTSDMILNTRCLESSMMAARTELTSSGVPLPKKSYFKEYKVRVMPRPVQNYGVDGLSVFELGVEDIFQEIDRQGSNVAEGIMAVAKAEKKLINDILLKSELKKHDSRKPLRKSDTLKNNDKHELKGITERFNELEDNDQIHDKEYTEAQIEEMNVKAERERKLKEHRQMLKMKKTPSQVQMMYFTAFVVLTTAFTCHLATLVMKGTISEYFIQASEAVTHMEDRKSATSLMAFYAMKLKNEVQYAVVMLGLG